MSRDFSQVSHSVEPKGWDSSEDVLKVANTIWNPNTLQWERETTPEIPTTASTATLTNVSSSASSVVLLAANSSRLGFTIWNDSTAILYVKFGVTASATSCTVKMVADAYYEVPFKYTGEVDGIWASANGAARITELTA